MSRMIQKLDANATTGKSAERSCIGAYARACWIACPTSWAATATPVTLAPS